MAKMKIQTLLSRQALCPAIINAHLPSSHENGMPEITLAISENKRSSMAL